VFFLVLVLDRLLVDLSRRSSRLAIPSAGPLSSCRLYFIRPDCYFLIMAGAEAKDLQSIVQAFREDGFIVVRRVFEANDLVSLVSALTACIRDVAPTLDPGEIYYEDAPDRPIKSMFRLENHHETFRSLLSDARLGDLARAIYDDPDALLWTSMFFGKPARSGSEAPPHQDNIFQCWKPPEAMTMTIAVDASTSENGALIFQKGSHKLGTLPHLPSNVMGFSQRLIDPLDTSQYPEVEIHMKPGDVCLHAVDSVHRSGRNRTGQTRRQLAIGCYSSRARRDEQMWASRLEIAAKLHADNA